MSRAQEELGKFIMRNRPKSVVDERECDVVVVNKDSRVVESITVWRRVSVDRCLRLVEREMRDVGEKEEAIGVLSGRAVIGRVLEESNIIHI